MDIKKTEDRAVSTDSIGDNSNSCNELKKSISCNGLTKTEKKKSENKKLKQKLNEIEEHNESLTKLISDKSNEISELRRSINSLNEVINSVPINELRANSSIASAKLLELSKKNRQLRAELETTKNRLGKKDQQVQKLEKDLKTKQEKLEQNKEVTKNLNPACIEEMQGKLSALQQKLFETRNKNVELNTQLKLAQKCLQQEIGESFNMNLLAGQVNSASWRGRAQQILHLQQKIKELQERLDGNKKNEFNNENMFLYADTNLSSNNSYGSIERPCVRKTEIHHRAKVDNLEKEIANLKAELDDSRSKILALKVRNKTLNEEISRCKQKANSLEEQTDFNSFNVATMNDRLNQQKAYYEKLLSDSSKEKETLIKQRQDMFLKEEHWQEKISELETVVEEKDATINELNLLAKRLEQDLRAVSGDFLFSCRELRKEEFICILDTLETEKNSLLALNTTLNERLAQERVKNDGLCDQVAKQRIRISRLESKVRDLERELELQTEKKKRIQRIADYTSNLSTASSTTSLGSFIFENSSIASATSNNKTEQASDEDASDLRNRLELATEKVTMLREKLDHINVEKENDVKTFHEIINSSKNVLVEMIKAHHHRRTISPADQPY